MEFFNSTSPAARFKAVTRPACRRRLPQVLAAALLLTACATAPTRAQEAEPKEQAAAPPVGAWELETIEVAGRGEVHGLIESRAEGELTFVEVVRRPGESMFLVRRWSLPEKGVKIRAELPRQKHAELAERIERFANRRNIDSSRMASLELAPLSREGRRFLAYSGPWFDLWSDADDETTRKLIVRVEPMFSAFAQILPPRREPEKRLTIVIFDAVDDYRGYLHERNLEALASAAFYSRSRNEIVAGSELGRYRELVAEIRDRNAALVKHYELLEAELPAELARHSRELRAAGLSTEEIRGELKIRRAAWNKEFEALRAEIAAVERRNEEAFAAVAREMLARLYHEAFHAYLENYLFPAGEYNVPRWFNEGLAQVFEAGRLEADSLRLDAPPSDQLMRLQAELRSDSPLPLAELLTAPDERFLLVHGGDRSYARYYLYAWGLAFHLVFHENALQPERLEALFDETSQSPKEKLAEWVGPLPEFEARWRQAMLRMRVPR